MEATIPGEKLGLVLKVGLYAFLAFIGLLIFGPMLRILGYLIAAALGTFAAAAVANAIAVRIFERGRLADIGMQWTAVSPRNIGAGLAAGFLAAAIVIGPALLIGAAYFEPDAQFPGSWSAFGFVTVMLLFGSVGEEMLFRGYGFQRLVQGVGPLTTVLGTSLLFGWAHSANQNVSALGLVNTVGFGVVLGYAFLRSRDLWLPIGLHFGWNWALVVFGVNVSGFRMGVTGYVLRWRAPEIWSGGSYGIEASILTCFVVVLLLLYLRRAPIDTPLA